jgi:hypothetical protein
MQRIRAYASSNVIIIKIEKINLNDYSPKKPYAETYYQIGAELQKVDLPYQFYLLITQLCDSIKKIESPVESMVGGNEYDCENA